VDYIAYIVMGIVVAGVIYVIVVGALVPRKCPVCGSKNITQRRDKVIQNNNGNHDLVDEFADVCLNCGNKKVIPSNTTNDTML
jgi:hypothetical protein